MAGLVLYCHNAAIGSLPGPLPLLVSDVRTLAAAQEETLRILRVLRDRHGLQTKPLSLPNERQVFCHLLLYSPLNVKCQILNVIYNNEIIYVL